MLGESAVAFFGRFAAYENISRDEQEAYDRAAKSHKTHPSKKPFAGKFRGLPESDFGI